MKSYYIHNGQQQLGPFTFEELKEQGIMADTSVWHDGISNWTLAKEIPELKEMFSQGAPPPFKAYMSSVPAQIPVKKKGGGAAKISLVIGLIIGGFLFYKYYQSTHPSGVTFEYAARDLDAGGKYSIGPFGMKGTINGFIRNSSTRTHYTDVTIQIHFYDKNDIELGSEYRTISDYFPAGSSKDFLLKVDMVKGAKKLGWSVSNATAQ